MLPQKRMREGLLRRDRDVRDAALQFFSGPCRSDPGAMAVVIQCVEALGWEQAFSCSSYSYLPGLTQTGATIDWLLGQLANQESRQYMTAAQAKNAVIASVFHCDPLLLRERIATLR